MKKYIVVKVYGDSTIGSTAFNTDSREDARLFAELMGRTYGCEYIVLQKAED